MMDLDDLLSFYELYAKLLALALFLVWMLWPPDTSHVSTILNTPR